MGGVLGHAYVLVDILKENNFKKFAEGCSQDVIDAGPVKQDF